jgi:transcription termination factor Rho
MSSVLDRPGLEKSPLADLHLLAGELGVENFRRLRKGDLIDAILARQTGEETAADEPEEIAEEADEAADRPRRGRRGGRSRARSRDADPDDEASDDDAVVDDAVVDDAVVDDAPAPVRDDDVVAEKPRGRGRGRDRDRDRDREDEGEDKVAEGVVELLANGSGFVRLAPPEPTDDDVYVSAAQVKRCELVSGDRVSGPVRAPRRSERFPSLIRVDTINGRPADEVAEGTRFEDLPAAFPTERFELGSEDPTVKAIQWLTPFGKGSRVVIAGPARAGKSEALKRLAAALAGREGLEVSVVLAGVRPEEVSEWAEGPVAPLASLSFAASPDAQAQAIEQAIEQGRRVAARGGDAVVLADTLEYLSAGAARRALAAARNITGGGSLTVIATAAAPLGGETTVVALDEGMTALGRFPALDLTRSGTLRPDLLVGDAGAQAIAKARAEAGPA